MLSKGIANNIPLASHPIALDNPDWTNLIHNAQLDKENRILVKQKNISSPLPSRRSARIDDKGANMSQ